MPEPRIYSLRAGSSPAPPDAVYVGRVNHRRSDCPANPWHNPFRCEVESDNLAYLHSRGWACAEFEKYAVERVLREPDWLTPLRGLSLICWCHPKKCHAETLLRLANLLEVGG